MSNNYYELAITFQDSSQVLVIVPGNTTNESDLASALYTAATAEGSVSEAALNLYSSPTVEDSYTAPELVVTPTTVTTPTTPSGQLTDTFTVALSSSPSSSVTVTLTADATYPGSPPSLAVSPSTMTFDSGDWSTAQTATVTVQNVYGVPVTFGTVTVSDTSGASPVVVTVKN